MHLIWWAFVLARLRAGNNIPARMAIMAMTTSNSINVKARQQRVMFLKFRCSWQESILLEGLQINFRNGGALKRAVPPHPTHALGCAGCTLPLRPAPALRRVRGETLRVTK